MALLNIGDDPWLLEHESCERLYRDIMEQLNLRQREFRTSDKYAQISATIRLWLKQYNNELVQLKKKLQDITKAGSITQDESERRTRQVEILQTKATQMQKLFNEQTFSANNERSLLMGNDWASSSNIAPIRVNPVEGSVNDLKGEQKKMLAEQERGLENLSQIISRQKEIGNTISNEIDLHNEIIDDLGDHIERTDMRVRSETENVTVIDNKDKTCGYWVVIILLFISIITVAVI